MAVRLIVLTLVLFFSAPSAAQACDTLPEGFISCEFPIAQRPFIITSVPLDCALRENAQSLTLRCRIDIGKEDKWIPGPKPVVHLPKLPKKKKKAKR